MPDKKKTTILPLAAAAIACAAGLAAALFETLANDMIYGGAPTTAFRLGMGALERLLLTLACVALIAWAGYGRLFRPALKGGRVAALAALCVALANFPFIALAGGELAYTSDPALLALFGLNCLAVGLFEECAFRGLLFPLLLSAFEKRDVRRADVLAILASSAIFGLFHLVNLFAGAGIGPTLLQVGYTFLVGCMFAALTLFTRSVLPAVLIHALYDVGGTAVSLGVADGPQWNAPSVAIMVAASLFTAAAVIVTLVLRKRGATDAFLERH